MRAGKFYEYLPEFDWAPHVLTVYPATDQLPEPDLPHVVRTNYASPWKWLERRRARATKMEQSTPAWSLRQAATRSTWRQRAYFLLRHMLPMSSVRMPDATLGWYPFAVKAGSALLRDKQFEVIWSSAGPPTAHLIAAKLHRQTGIPWVADFRDLWTLNHQESRLWPFHSFEAWLERHTLKSATRITTISMGLAQMLSDFYGREIDVVYNGYDDAVTQMTQTTEPHFTLRYTGSLYPELDDVQPFLQALVLARELEPTFLPRIQIIGPESGWVAHLVETYNLSDMIECLKPVSRAQALTLQQHSTTLLLFGRSCVGKPGVLPTKMFEYMRTGRLVLEIGPKQSESASVITKCRAGLTLEKPEEIGQVLLSWWYEFQRAGTLSWSTNLEQVAQYSRRAQTKCLAKLLDNCLC